MTSRTKLTRKQVDDVLGGDEAWKHADSTAGMHPTRILEPIWLTKLESDMSKVRQRSCLLLPVADQIR